jgi:pimeloyl-ACP methyl ester carboxylesterase
VSGPEKGRSLMRFPTLNRRWSVSILLLVLSLAGFGSLPLVEARQDDAATASPVSSSLQWGPCDDVPDAECASIDVPIDPAQPDGDQLSLRLGRLPALDPSHSQGSLLLIPGGPGVGISAAGGQFVVLRPLFHLDELRQTFDVVTYDPRGIGESSPILCATGAAPDAGMTITASDGVLSADGFASLAGPNAAFAEGCLSATGELYRHLSANDAAADIERIRLALGQDDGLVAYSGSYGTLYATAYLEQYGDHVKALVLDGVVDHSVDLATYGARWARSTDDALNRFVQWCDRETSCALHGQDVAAVFAQIAAAHPEIKPVVRARLSAGSTDLGWPAIADLLATAASEPVSASPQPEASPVSTDATLDIGGAGQFRAVLCADYGPQDDFAAMAADNAALARQAPHFAWLFPEELPGACVGWPWEATNPPHDPQVGPQPNVLVANATHDPATPLVAAVEVWSQIPQSRLLIADADGHQVLPFSRCGFEAEVRFLTDPSSLDSTTYCPN